jgi:SOS-response transcriptional repressor LexA
VEAAHALWSHLKPARRAAGKTAEEAGQALGVGADMIFRYEAGRSEISLTQLAKLAEFYRMQVGDIFPSSKPRTRELQPFLAALEDFEPDDRPAIIDKAARDLAFTSMMMNGRAAREIERHDNVLQFHADRAKLRITMSGDDHQEITAAIEQATHGALTARQLGRSDVPVPLLATAAASPDGKASFRRVDETRDINTYHWKHGVRYLIKVDGLSMWDMAIKSNDLLYMRPTNGPREGQAIACVIHREGEEQFFVKVYRRREDGSIVLSSENEEMKYADIVIPPDQADTFEYLGEVFGRYGDMR